MASTSVVPEGLRQDLSTYLPRRVVTLPDIPNQNFGIYYWDAERLSIKVVDSPINPPDVADDNSVRTLVAIILVPRDRESDWMYDTDAGACQLIGEYQSLTRLIIVKNAAKSRGPYIKEETNADDRLETYHKLKEPLNDLCLGAHNLYLISHQDEVLCSTWVGSGHQMMDNMKAAIEDVALPTECRRRLRFNGFPGVYQADCLLQAATKSGISVKMESKYLLNSDDVDLTIDIIRSLSAYMQVMAHGLIFISSHLAMQFESTDANIQILSLGLGAGVFERFLHTKFGASVVAIEEDDDLYDLVKVFFNASVGEKWNEELTVIEGISARKALWELTGNYPTAAEGGELGPKYKLSCGPHKGVKYDLVVLDITDSDAIAFRGVCAPPRYFLEHNGIAIENIAKLLNDGGALVVHVIAPDFVFAAKLRSMLVKNFSKIYKLNIPHGNNEEFIYVAIVSTVDVGAPTPNVISEQIKSLVPGSFISTEIKEKHADEEVVGW